MNNKMKDWLINNKAHLTVVGVFILVCFLYFSPVLQGKTLFQGDVLEAQSMQKEIMDVRAQIGEGPLWTNAMFGGMPSYQIWVQYPYNITTYIVSFFKTVANYILRAAVLPAGNHKLEFKFEPKSYYWGEKISLAASVLLLLGIIMSCITWRKETPGKSSSVGKSFKEMLK